MVNDMRDFNLYYNLELQNSLYYRSTPRASCSSGSSRRNKRHAVEDIE